MAILYKTFLRRRTVFYAVFACFFLLHLATAQAADLFTVEDIQVDVTADSAVAARGQAFEEAQKKAFEALAQRMIPQESLATLEIPEPLAISTMIQDYEIMQEKLSTVRYIATYTFRFKDQAVRDYFTVRGASFTDIASRPVLVLPFFQRGSEVSLWSPYNIWMQAWNRLEGGGALVPVLVPIGDLEDVRDISDQDALSYNPARLENLLARYGAGEALIVIAQPDQAFLRAPSQDSAAGSLTVRVYKADAFGPQPQGQIVVQAQPGQSRDSMLDAAVAQVQDALRSGWKAQTLITPQHYDAGNRLRARIRFDSLEQWTQSQSLLQRVSGVQVVDVQSLSPREAEVEIVYSGDQQRLQIALQQAGMTLAAPVVSSSAYGAPQTGGAPAVYDLYIGDARGGVPGAYQPDYQRQF